MNALKLWEVGDELAEIAMLIMEAEGELTPDLEARLDEMEGAFDTKVERCALKVRELKANAKAAKEEADRLTKIVRGFTRAAKGLESYMLRQMERTGNDRIETPRAKVWVQRNGRPSIRWTGEPESAPEAYRKVTVSVDTQAAYEAWKADETLPDGFEVEVGHHLRIG